ncbi:MAG: histidine triad family protein [Pyrinomonadaceae bacterium]|jgi:histidine triad (HIT) family protein|nr:histidine triad family protein [Pyrinomonadaceae bacterium]
MGFMKNKKFVLSLCGAFVLGVVLGGYLFARTLPRSFLALNHCQGTCFQANELLGLFASVGIQQLPALIPKVVMETDKTIVIEHPSPQARIHYLIIPKRDIKNVGELSAADNEYLVDMLRVAGEVIREQKLTSYKLISNGPAYQGVTYMHFHLMAQ